MRPILKVPEPPKMLKVKNLDSKKIKELEIREQEIKRRKFQENYLDVRQTLLQQKAELNVQIRSLEAQVESIERTLNGWDLTLIHSYEVK